MFVAFVRSWFGWLLLLPVLLRSIPANSLPVAVKRTALFAFGWVGFGLLNALHWIGFAADEIFFRGYRAVEIRRPIAIVGVPRSGTTFLQRALATEPHFTTLTLLECVLAPSISERYVWFGIRRLFERILPGRSLRVDSMESIHPIGIDEPEEDFILLLWVHACFLLTVVAPNAERFWRLARFDRKVSALERRDIFTFYRLCLQKHLYFHGPEKRLLSKNPSFTPMLDTLVETFPDAIVVGCVRPPEKTVPSQLSSLLPAFLLLGDGTVPDAFSARMIRVLKAYYADLQSFAASGSIYVVEMTRLNEDLEEVVAEIFERADHEPSATFHARLSSLAAGGRSYMSAHRYSAADFGLTVDQIEDFFSEVWPLSLPATKILEHR